jgi:aquaporin Z
MLFGSAGSMTMFCARGSVALGGGGGAATFFFLYVIIGTTSKGAAVGFAGIPIGLCLTLIHLFLIPVTNPSVNPARSTGPALFAGGAYIAQLWLFWLTPMLGAALAGVVARWQHEADHK